MHRLQLGKMGRLDGLKMGAIIGWLSQLLRELNSPNSATYPQQEAHCELVESLMHDGDPD
jgi:hypothetical protein